MIHISRARAVLWGVAILLLLGFAWQWTSSARASLGNTGIPVRCSASSFAESTTKTLKCYAADGTLFTNSDERVPTGYYLLVTDIILVPDGGSDASAVISADLMAKNPSNQFMRLRNTNNAMQPLHFTSPYFVLKAGQYLTASNAWFSQEWIYVYASGLLVQNVSYLPITVR
ncbi:MAG: hypothetical protein GXP41_07765 [Chloroflexi bacterium]|nr:hypothetical protein [Chloroflexota bacterium]